MARPLDAVVEFEIGDVVVHRAMPYADPNERLHGVVVRWLIAANETVTYGVEWETDPTGLSFHTAEALSKVEVNE